jgi:hypothetical protein
MSRAAFSINPLSFKISLWQFAKSRVSVACRKKKKKDGAPLLYAIK